MRTRAPPPTRSALPAEQFLRRGRYGVDEGVVCKGGLGGDDLWMVKIKTDAYLQRLKQAFAERWEDYWE